MTSFAIRAVVVELEALLKQNKLMVSQNILVLLALE